MKAIQWILVTTLFAVMTAWAQAQSNASVSEVAPAQAGVAQDAELAKKIAASQAYKEKDSFDILFNTMYQGQPYSATYKVNVKDGYTIFSNSGDPCFRGRVKTSTSVDLSTGELVLDFILQMSFCNVVQYRFPSPASGERKGKLVVRNPQSQQIVPSQATVALR